VLGTGPVGGALLGEPTPIARPSISQTAPGCASRAQAAAGVDQQSLFDEFGQLLGETVGDGCPARGDEPAGRAAAAAVGRLDDREVIVSGSYDGTVRIWDAIGRPRATR
jgi:hypothetical protein